MEVICIDDSMYFTKGKVYITTSHTDSNGDVCYSLIDDVGDDCWYNGGMFIPLFKWREQQLNKIIL